jgi:hypothetical protein
MFQLYREGKIVHEPTGDTVTDELLLSVRIVVFTFLQDPNVKVDRVDKVVYAVDRWL